MPSVGDGAFSSGLVQMPCKVVAQSSAKERLQMPAYASKPEGVRRIYTKFKALNKKELETQPFDRAAAGNSTTN